MEEIWKDVKGYEGTYQVSNLGRVRRLTFVNNHVNKEKVHIIDPTDNGNGYLIVGFKVNGHRQNKYVHRLVADAFCARKTGLNVVNHIDFDKYNNNAANLEWCTQKDNVMASRHRMRHEKVKCKPTKTGEKYIMLRGNKYRVVLKQFRQDRSFKTLEAAIKFRDSFIKPEVN